MTGAPRWKARTTLVRLGGFLLPLFSDGTAEATRSEDDEVEALRRAIAVFVAHHAHHPREALIGNREVASLEEPARSELLALRRVVLEHAHLTSGSAVHAAAGVFLDRGSRVG